MPHRSDFTMKLTNPGQMSMCDVCASIMPNDQERVQTFIGGAGQSDVCVDCANAIAALVRKVKREVAV